MEYSTISMLDDFWETLANVGLTEAWLEWKSNDTTQEWTELNWKIWDKSIQNQGE